MKTIDASPQWFVVRTRPRAEKQVAARFGQLGIPHYLALRREQRTWGNRRQWVEKPVFPAYIFVHVHPAGRVQVFDAPGVMHYVTIGGKIAVLRSAEIDRVKNQYSAECVSQTEKTHRTFAPGEAVEITGGPFSGKRGQVAATRSGHYVEIRLEDLFLSATIQVPRTEVEKYPA